MARETKWHDGDARHERVALPENWSRAIPLHGAVMNGHYQSTLPYLVETLGAPVGGVCPRDGNTPCHTAVVWGHLHVVAYLLARGARHDAKNDHGFDLAALATLTIAQGVAERVIPLALPLGRIVVFFG